MLGKRLLEQRRKVELQKRLVEEETNCLAAAQGELETIQVSLQHSIKVKQDEISKQLEQRLAELDAEFQRKKQDATRKHNMDLAAVDKELQTVVQQKELELEAELERNLKKMRLEMLSLMNESSTTAISVPQFVRELISASPETVNNVACPDVRNWEELEPFIREDPLTLSHLKRPIPEVLGPLVPQVLAHSPHCNDTRCPRCVLFRMVTIRQEQPGFLKKAVQDMEGLLVRCFPSACREKNSDDDDDNLVMDANCNSDRQMQLRDQVAAVNDLMFHDEEKENALFDVIFMEWQRVRGTPAIGDMAPATIDEEEEEPGPETSSPSSNAVSTPSVSASAQFVLGSARLACLKTKSSKFRGVARAGPNASNRWTAQITVAGKKQYLGCFETEEKAGRAYDQAAVQVHGEKARINFPHL